MGVIGEDNEEFVRLLEKSRRGLFCQIDMCLLILCRLATRCSRIKLP